MDDEIVKTCSSAQFDLGKGLARTLQAETKPMITQCCIQKLYLSRDQQAIDMAKQFERRRCNHREAIEPHECIKSIVCINDENKHRYVVASDNERLRFSLRKIAGVPLVYMNRSVMIMEPLSKASGKVSNNVERKKLTQGLNNVKSGVVDEKKDAPVQEGEEKAKKAKKRGGSKEPNPLSMKKKKTTQEQPPTPQQKPQTAETTKRRKRSHKKRDSTVQDGESTETTESKPEATTDAQQSTS